MNQLTNDQACAECTATISRVMQAAMTLPEAQAEALHRVSRAVFASHLDDHSSVWGLRTLPDFQALELVAMAMKAPEPQAAPPPAEPAAETENWIFKYTSEGQRTLTIPVSDSGQLLWAAVRSRVGYEPLRVPLDQLKRARSGFLEVRRTPDEFILRAVATGEKVE